MELICLGDSLTFGYGVRNSYRFTVLAAEACGIKITNLGVCGDTTGGMLQRLHSQILTSPSYRDARPDKPRILLMGGCNDIFYSGTDTGARANMGSMIHQLLSLGQPPLVGIPMHFCGSMPAEWESFSDRKSLAPVFDRYYSWLEAFCAAFHIPVLDFRPDFLLPDGRPDPSLFVDGIHPNAQGHARMARRLCAFLMQD